MSTKALIPTQVGSFAGSEVMLRPVEELTDSEAATAHLTLKLVGDLIKERAEILRLRLLDAAVKAGKQTEKGGYRYDTADDLRILRERREKVDLSLEKVLALLEKNGVPVQEGCDEVKTLVVNRSKIQHLVDTGKLPKKDVEALVEVTYALRVFPSDTLAALLEQARSNFQSASNDKVLPPPAAEGEKVKAARAK